MAQRVNGHNESGSSHGEPDQAVVHKPEPRTCQQHIVTEAATPLSQDNDTGHHERTALPKKGLPQLDATLAKIVLYRSCSKQDPEDQPRYAKANSWRRRGSNVSGNIRIHEGGLK